MVNDVRVAPGRLAVTKPTGGAVEVLLVKQVAGREWEALVRPSRRVSPGTVLSASDGPLVEVGEDLGEGRRRVRTIGPRERLAAQGEVPLPPYITEGLSDPERYQTVYARRAAAAAAPTAGLHLTTEVLDRCRAGGATVVAVELEVGFDTFRPIRAEFVEDHQMHSERYHVPPAVLRACGRADRVLAVGTTTLRALEAAADTGASEGETDLFIRRPFDFQVVDLLLTNFHVPRSSLLVLIDAFVGRRWRSLYVEALERGYRFLSFGDAMLLTRHPAR